MSLTLDPETQQAFEKLLMAAQDDTKQGRMVASFLFTLWNAGKDVRTAVIDVWELDPEITRACAQLFAWLNNNKVFPEQFGRPGASGSAAQRLARWSMTLNRDSASPVDGRGTSDFALGLWNDRWFMSDEAVRCSYCLAIQLPSNAHIPLEHCDGCEISDLRYPLRDLAAILRGAIGDPT
ncbi:DUF7673 family protein [Pseudomonas trivialis]|uniref:DUF7673 domain-containing protein n=1 Tax=Pseudomonas trivialis TaxID=200450 RepID=A0A0H5AKU2_9PSED|nr:hypothetical protein [Pseudomonas trivialis]AKS04667.1 hypothetical protein AA957_00540 [Pseudomonas trivialis]